MLALIIILSQALLKLSAHRSSSHVNSSSIDNGSFSGL